MLRFAADTARFEAERAAQRQPEKKQTVTICGRGILNLSRTAVIPQGLCVIPECGQ